MRIISKKFVHCLMLSNDMDTTKTYTFDGEYVKDKNMAVFSLVDHKEFFRSKAEKATSEE